MNLKVKFSLQENQPGSNSVHIVGACSSVVLEQNPVQDSLAALLLHSQSYWIWFGLFLVHRFTLSSGLVFSFWCVFWSCGSSVFQCNFLVILCRGILHQVRYIPEVINEPCSTLFLILKSSLIEFCAHSGCMQFGCFWTKSSARQFSRFASSQPIL